MTFEKGRQLRAGVEMQDKITGGISDEVRELQNNAVTELVKKARRAKEVTFKAPTGSGKTFMMADFMNRMLEDNRIIFIVSTLSKGGLAAQNYQKFLEYSLSRFTRLKPYLINTDRAKDERLFISAEYNVYVLPRDLVKSTGKLQAGVFKDFLNTVTGKTSLFDGKGTAYLSKQIYVIKDECHDATNRLDELKAEYFTKIINFSATPNLKRGQVPDVEITEREAIEAALIKRLEWGEEDDTLDEALTEFEKTREGFRKVGINSAFIIQISNKEAAEEEIENIIRPALANHPSLKWMLIVDNLKKCETNDELEKRGFPRARWKEYLKEDTSSIDVIIFKMVITEGYDAPRASMLFQIRDTKSKTLEEQVLGRIRRNPCLLGFEGLTPEQKKLVTTAKAWGKKPNGAVVINVQLKDKELQNRVKIKTTKLLPLTERRDFDLGAFLESIPQTEKVMETNFFTLARKVTDAPSDIKRMIYAWVGEDINKWYKAACNIDEIIKRNNEYILDYEKSMKEGVQVSLPLKSYSTGEGNYTPITSWVWRKTKGGGEKDEFAFDSSAERIWAVKLEALAKDVIKKEENVLKEEVSLWGKNFLPNSEVKFEYYNFGNHNSYPDFVMVDKFDRVHIFEVKSLDERGDGNVDKETYEEKIRHLREAYKAASRITKQYFYIPIRRDEEWTIFAYKDGKEEKKTTEEFENDIRAMN